MSRLWCDRSWETIWTGRAKNVYLSCDSNLVLKTTNIKLDNTLIGTSSSEYLAEKNRYKQILDFFNSEWKDKYIHKTRFLHFPNKQPLIVQEHIPSNTELHKYTITKNQIEQVNEIVNLTYAFLEKYKCIIDLFWEWWIQNYHQKESDYRLDNLMVDSNGIVKLIDFWMIDDILLGKSITSYNLEWLKKYSH